MHIYACSDSLALLVSYMQSESNGFVYEINLTFKCIEWNVKFYFLIMRFATSFDWLLNLWLGRVCLQDVYSW